MKILRFIVVVAVLAYAGWLAWPYLAPLIGADVPTSAGSMRAAAAAPEPLFGLIPWWGLLVAAVGLYVVAALMLGAGNSKAVLAYFLGFVADAALRLAVDGRSVPDVFAGPEAAGAPARAAASGLPVDPLWLVLGGLVLLGVLVAVASRRIRRRRVAGQFAY